MFNLPSVHLITDPISKFTEKGVEVAIGGDGEEKKQQIDLDVVIMATGFDPIGSFASAFDVGGDVQYDKEKELYETAPKAYLGSCLVWLVVFKVLHLFYLCKNNLNLIFFFLTEWCT